MQQLDHFLRPLWRVRGDPDIQRLTALYRMSQRRGGFFHRRIFIDAMRVKDIDILKPHTLQALVEAGEQVFT
ncbi:Uncharacterised protein [Shigella flexneri]|nr:Uncharacterised protein [Shigella flexneri]